MTVRWPLKDLLWNSGFGEGRYHMSDTFWEIDFGSETYDTSLMFPKSVKPRQATYLSSADFQMLSLLLSSEAKFHFLDSLPKYNVGEDTYEPVPHLPSW